MKGIIDLLSNHLYSNPQVFVRELLQNCTDAIEARRFAEPEHVGTIEFEVIKAAPPNAPTLVIRDNGIGLTEAEVHQFLATIGESSKKAAVNREDFIGQFGIGLLSAFLVCEEIVVITRSIEPDSTTVQWKGRSDGTYLTSTIDRDFEPGTEVFIRAKHGCFDFFDFDFIADSVAHYGRYLGHQMTVSCGDQQQQIEETPPWAISGTNRNERRDELLEFGRQSLDREFFDAIPVVLPELGVEGVIFVLPRANRSTRNHLHQIYLKNMLLTESVDNLLPDWAFFVTCVLNVRHLRPTAARESFYEDDQLAETRLELGRLLKQYMTELAESDPDRLSQFLALHYLSIKALAIEDDDFYAIFIDWLPFETNMGHMTLAEYQRLSSEPVSYVATVDQFRQVANVAAAQSRCLFNAGFTYDAELLDKLNNRPGSSGSELVDPGELAQELEELSEAEQDRVASLIETAGNVLAEFECEPDVRKFDPADLPALLTTNRDAGFLRSVEQAREDADSLFSDILGTLGDQVKSTARTQLCLNFRNGLIRKLASVSDETILRQSIEMLYVQSLLLGRFPVTPNEMQLLGKGMLGMIEASLDAKDQGGSQ